MNIRRNKRHGFSLIEMVGVLAIIAILAAILIPKIFAAINESRINNATVSFNTVKTAAMTYFGKYGRFGKVDGTAYDSTADLPFADWDGKVLMAGGFLEKQFALRIGTDPDVQVVAAIAAGTAADPTNAAYDLDGDATVVNDASGGQCVVQCVIPGCPAEDAAELSLRIDGKSLSETDLTKKDITGRVKYADPVGGVTDVYIYVAHK